MESSRSYNTRDCQMCPGKVKRVLGQGFLFFPAGTVRVRAGDQIPVQRRREKRIKSEIIGGAFMHS